MRYEIDLTVVPRGVDRGLVLPDNHLANLRAMCAGDVHVVTDRTIWAKHLLSTGYSQVDLRQFASIKRQTGPSCTSNAWTGAMKALYRFSGYDACPELSAASLFSFVGSFRGSSIQDNQRRLLTVGCVPESLWPSSAINGRPPAGFEAEAPKWRLRAVEYVTDFAAGTWTLFRGRPVVFGVDWGGGGHCIWATRVFKGAKGWAWEIANSWGEDWGDRGFGLLYEDQIARGIRNRYGAAAPLLPTYEA
jgi:hypothetical protein